MRNKEKNSYNNKSLIMISLTWTDMITIRGLHSNTFTDVAAFIHKSSEVLYKKVNI